MGFSKKIKGLTEDEIKKKIKKYIIKDKIDKILNSSVYNKYSYIKDIVEDSTKELELLFSEAKYIFECPKERYLFIKNNI